MSGISTHVLDTTLGRPAKRIRVILEHRGENGDWRPVGEGITDDNGRISQFLGSEQFQGGFYRLIFFVSDYFQGRDWFYPNITVDFLARDPSAHYHVPLLLSPYGYTTYRGS